MKVFLDGTENASKWRLGLIQHLEMEGIEYFDPTTQPRSKRTAHDELDQKKESQAHVYVITPKMDDFENVSELVEDSNKNPSKNIFSYLSEDEGEQFNQHQVKSLKRVGEMIEKNGATYCNSEDAIRAIAEELSKRKSSMK